MPEMPRFSGGRLWRRIFLSYLWLILASILLSMLAVGAYFRVFYIDQTDKHLEAMVKSLAVSIEPVMRSGTSGAELEALAKRFQASVDERLTIVSPQGRVLADSQRDPKTMENHRTRPEIAAALRGRLGYARRLSDTLDVEMVYFASPVTDGKKVIGVVRVSGPPSDVYAALPAILVTIGWSALISLFLAAMLSLYMTWRVVDPLAELRRATRRIAEGRFSGILRIKTGDELEELADDLLTMSEQLKRRIDLLEAERTRSEAIVRNVADGIIVTDEKGTLLSVNAALAGMFHGSSLDDSRDSIVRATGDINLQRLIEASLAGSRAEGELSIQGPAGEMVIEVTAVPLKDEDGHIFGTVTTLHDSTAQRLSIAMRQQFFANASHELRTPIANMLALIETLQDEKLQGDRRRQFFERIVSEGSRLAELADDVLELTALESGTLDAGEAVCSANEAVREAVARAADAAARKSIVVGAELPDAELSLRVKKRHLASAIDNLIENAVKYTDSGGEVKVSLYLEGDEVKIAVSDNGTGIPAEDQPRVFERFFRVDRDRSRSSGGTGLGLSIVKHFATGYGGRVEVSSVIGKGSVFTIHLPAGS